MPQMAMLQYCESVVHLVKPEWKIFNKLRLEIGSNMMSKYLFELFSKWDVSTNT